MPDSTSSLQVQLEKVRDLLEKFRVEKHLVDVSPGQQHELEFRLLHGQQTAELQRRLHRIHLADLGKLMESLPGQDRSTVWECLSDEQRGSVLMELDEAVAERLIAATESQQLLAALATLDADDLVALGDMLPKDILNRALELFATEQRHWVRETLTYPENKVGHLMTSDMMVVAMDSTLQSVQELLREKRELAVHTDKLMVTDERGVLCGVLCLPDILVNDPQVKVADAMKSQVVSFYPDGNADDAARAFERYDLASAPVINARGKLIGRLTVDAVMDYVRGAAEMDALNVAGVVDSEDLFAGVWDSARNRWLWLSINLVSAFVISRIIGAFEATIVQLVALASLMPIVASVAGNTGNQTTAIVIRSLAMDQIHSGNIWHLYRKELGIALLNGVVWGIIVGLFAYLFYHNLQLSLVVAVAMLLTFVLAALFGVTAPLVLERMGKDPAMGSSVILTGVTDALGFLIFLMLASALLV